MLKTSAIEFERNLDREGAAPRHHFDKATPLQRAQRLAHRPMADAELRGDLLLGDVRAAAILALDDGDADTIGNLL